MRPVLITAAFLLSLAANCIGQNASLSQPSCDTETSRPDKPQAVNFLEKLKAAVERDDHKAVAEMVRFPIAREW